MTDGSPEFEVGFVVEGHGDIKAVPTVFRRIAELEFPQLRVITREVFRVARDKLKKQDELERTVELLARRLNGTRAILITIDTEGEAPGCLGPELLRRACLRRPDVSIGVALAHHEFENWFIAAAESLAGFRDLQVDIVCPQYPESIRGAKEWLSARMVGRPYRETTDQDWLAKRFALNAACKARSFSKFYREAVRLCQGAIETNSRPAGLQPEQR